MSKANVLISETDYGYAIKVDGRANMECSPSLKNFGENIVHGAFSKIVFDMEDCKWMDSTFMGTLAMLGIKAKKVGILIEMLNLESKNRGLLQELGIEALFNFVNAPSHSFDLLNSEKLNSSPSSLQSTAETVLKAHETLVEVNQANESKFGKVIEMVKREIEDSSDKK